jgi:RNA polymerase sigma factor (sigma-70 family)
MPRNKKDKIPPVEALLSAKEKSQLSHIEDKLLNVGDFPALLLIGVDSNILGQAFVKFTESKSPIPVALHEIRTSADAAPLKNAEGLDPDVFHLFYFFDYYGSSPQEVASNLIFYRDYIPQYRLKIIIIASHKLLKVIIEEAYDFYSISGFTGFFIDFPRLIQRDIARFDDLPEPVQQYERNMAALKEYREQENISPGILLKKMYNAAVSARDTSRLDEALHLLQQALELAMEQGSQDSETAIYIIMGDIYFSRGHTPEALNYFREALEISRKIKDSAKGALALVNIGHVCSRRGSLEEALDYYIRARGIHRKAGDLKEMAAVFNHIGKIYMKKGEIKEAHDYFDKALSIAEQNSLLDLQSESLAEMGNISRLNGDMDKALAYYQDALRISKRIGSLKGEALVLNNIANLFAVKGEFAVSMKYHKRTLKIAQEIEDLSLEALSLANIGDLFFKKGDLKEAIKYHEESLSAARKMENLLLESSVLGYIGNIFLEEDNFEKALYHYNRALKLAREVGDSDETAKQLINIGNLYRQENDINKSRKYLDEALSIAGKINSLQLEALAMHNIGQMHSKRENYDEALNYFNKALNIYKRIGDVEGEAAELLSIGTVHQHLKRDNEAIKYYNKALEIGRDKGFKVPITSKQAEVLFYSNLKKIRKILEKKGNIYRLDMKGLYEKFIKRIQDDNYKMIRDIPENCIFEEYLENLIRDLLIEETYFVLLEKGFISEIVSSVLTMMGIPMDLKDDILDYVQEKLEKNKLEKIKKFTEKIKFTTFLFTVVRHIILDYYRKKTSGEKPPRSFIDRGLDYLANVPELDYVKLEGEDIKEKISDHLPMWIEHLNNEEKLAFKMYYFQNIQNITAIARVLGTTRYKAEKVLAAATDTILKEIRKALKIS